MDIKKEDDKLEPLRNGHDNVLSKLPAKKEVSQLMELIDIHTRHNTGAYSLLQKYEREAKINAVAYKMSERYWHMFYKLLQYPLLVITTLVSVFATIDIAHYVLVSLSFVSLLLSGFITIINPKEKEQRANQVSNEFNMISSNICQFITENNKTKNELKAFSQRQLELLEIWNSLSPSIFQGYLKQASAEVSKPVRLASTPYTVSRNDG
jgi:hypothetical protein